VPRKPGLPTPSIVQAAPPPAASEPAPAPPDIMTTIPYADTIPSPPALDTRPETQPAKPTPVAAIPPKKPGKPAGEKSMVAKEHRIAPAQTVALHPPLSAPGNVAGPYRVQFGAFANEDNARRVQWAIEATGLKVDVSQAPGPSGHLLYFLRSPSYGDYGAAVSAAQTVQHRVNGFVNAIPIEYAILGDHGGVVQQAQR
jgi:cell division protein FtsN